ncbi:hypothetical protein GCM10010172_30220 [Paractinoplanes ferrugineus]|uniref:DUF2399 domain-containing protein n=1 Tax=Paractinoplanes ferrugineus TaxID=113564 RepID=A0A919J9P3_9ACTN|nr:TIGR02679 domain-containing protein [Actinoplanes ferrugineus]GIE15613.1 hypothetical protein Afe05nite_74530 [Actinoplanes ferrugineus]
MSDLNDPHLLPLWRAIKSRLIDTGELAKVRTVRVELSTAGLARLNGWFAQSRAARLSAINGWVRVPLDKIAAALGPETDLHTILQETVGLPDEVQPRLRLQTMKADFWNSAEIRLPKTPALVHYLRIGGLTDTTLEQRGRLINALARAHDLLPLQRPVPLPRLAYYCATDPHYFDFKSPGNGSKLVLLAAELLGENAIVARTPLERFHLLTRCGIVPDRISSTVIVLGIDAVGQSPIDDVVRQARAAPRPLHLSLYDLTMNPPIFSNAETVHVVENPSVLEEALIRRYRGPLACTSGTLSAVDHCFLQKLVDDRVPIVYSGDDDPTGRGITRTVYNRYGADPLIVGSSPDSDSANDSPIYQEDHRILGALLGVDSNDPLGVSQQ